MPNGNPDPFYKDEVLAGYEEYFAPIGNSLNEIARRHNLFIERYYHEAPCWKLCFANPRAGCAAIDVCRQSDETVLIVGVWWVDDYDCGTRSLKSTDKETVERDSASVERCVIAALKKVLSFEPGEWSQVVDGYYGIWSATWTKEQFQQLHCGDRWPVPRLDPRP